MSLTHTSNRQNHIIILYNKEILITLCKISVIYKSIEPLIGAKSKRYSNINSLFNDRIYLTIMVNVSVTKLPCSRLLNAIKTIATLQKIAQLIICFCLRKTNKITRKQINHQILSFIICRIILCENVLRKLIKNDNIRHLYFLLSLKLRCNNQLAACSISGNCLAD